MRHRLPHLLLAACAAVALIAQQATSPTLRLGAELTLRDGTARRLLWSADGRALASCGRLGDVRLVDIATGSTRELATGERAYDLALAPDGRTLAVAGEDLTLWDTETGAERQRASGHGHRAVAWSPDGKLVATIVQSSTIELRDGNDLHLVRSIAQLGDVLADSLAFSPDSACIALARHEGGALVFAVESGELLERHQDDGRLVAVRWLADGRLLRQSGDGTLRGFTTAPVRMDSSAYGLVADPAGRLCVAWSSVACQLRTADGIVREIAGGGPCAVHPDGATWVRARSGALEFCRGDEVLRRVALPHRGQPDAAAISADGRHVALGGAGSRIAVFDTDTGKPLELAHELRGRPIPYGGGTELAVWSVSPARPGPGSIGVLSLWPIAALVAGKPPARTVQIEFIEPTWRGGSTPQFASHGTFVGFGDVAHDTAHVDHFTWQAMDGRMRDVVPSPDGAWLLQETNHESGLGWTSRIELRRRDDAQPRFTDVRDDPMLPHDAAWSPSGNLIGVLDERGLRTFAPERPDDNTEILGRWTTFAWVDEAHVLLLTEPGELQLWRLAGEQPEHRLGFATGPTGLCVDANGTRAVVQLPDRAVVVRLRD